MPVITGIIIYNQPWRFVGEPGISKFSNSNRSLTKVDITKGEFPISILK
jgi:hypothetical protein